MSGRGLEIPRRRSAWWIVASSTKPSLVLPAPRAVIPRASAPRRSFFDSSGSSRAVPNHVTAPAAAPEPTQRPARVAGRSLAGSISVSAPLASPSATAPPSRDRTCRDLVSVESAIRPAYSDASGLLAGSDRLPCRATSRPRFPNASCGARPVRRLRALRMQYWGHSGPDTTQVEACYPSQHAHGGRSPVLSPRWRQSRSSPPNASSRPTPAAGTTRDPGPTTW